MRKLRWTILIWSVKCVENVSKNVFVFQFSIGFFWFFVFVLFLLLQLLIFLIFAWYNIIRVLPGSNVVANRIDGKQSKIIRTSNMFMSFFLFSPSSFFSFEKMLIFFTLFINILLFLYNYFHKIWALKSLTLTKHHRVHCTHIHMYVYQHVRHWKIIHLLVWHYLK